MRGIYSRLKICIDVTIICSFRITITKAFTAVWPGQLIIVPSSDNFGKIIQKHRKRKKTTYYKNRSFSSHNLTKKNSRYDILKKSETEKDYQLQKLTVFLPHFDKKILRFFLLYILFDLHQKIRQIVALSFFICSFRIMIPKAFTAVEVWPVQLTIAPLDQAISEAGKFKRKKIGGKPPIGQAHDIFSRIFQIRI